MRVAVAMSLATLCLAVALGGCEVAATPGSDVPDAGTRPRGSEGGGGGDAGDQACAEGVPGCTCTEVPPSDGAACTHTFGGVYADEACSGSYQCCNGEWAEGTAVCGACACTEPTGEEGCEPEPVLECHPVRRDEAAAARWRSSAASAAR